MSGVYVIRNAVNGKRYIGHSVDVYQRWRVHRHNLNQGNHHSTYLQRAWNKHGSAAFVWTVIERVENPSQLVAREQHWINHFAAYERSHGYNRAPTAKSPFGIKRSARTRALLRARFAEPDVRARRSAAQQKRWQDPARRKHVTTERTRERRAASLRAMWADPAFRARRKLPRLTEARRIEFAERMRALWARPDFRQRRDEALRAIPHEARSQILRERWADPDFRRRYRPPVINTAERCRRAEVQRLHYATHPERRLANAQHLKRPEVQARRLQKQREYFEARRQAKAEGGAR